MSQFLTQERQRLLAQTLAHTRTKPTARRRDPATPASLSFAQQRVWFLHHLDPANGHCNTPVAISLTGDLQVEIFERTLREIVRRHESWRTVFPVRNGEPVQVLSRNADIDFRMSDLSSLPPEEREGAAAAIFQEESYKRFKISEEPCVRFRLLRLSREVHRLLLVAHHMVFDTWSLGVFSREMSAIYKAFREGQPSPLPELDIQYADFAFSEKNAAEEGRLVKQLSYWKEKLRGAPELLPLPLDRIRQPFPDRTVGSETFCMRQPITEAVLALSHTERASVFMILLTALTILLFRYGSGRDVVVSSAFGNRKLRGTEALIGCFMNTLLFWIQLSGDPSFRELLRQVRENNLEAHEHSDIPIEQVVAALNPKRDPSYNPYSQVMLIVQNVELPSLTASGIEISRLPISERPMSQQDLTIHVRSLDGLMQGTAEYNAKLFDRSTIQRLLKHFERVLASALNNPDLLISQLDVMTPPEIHQLTRELNDTEVQYASDTCTHQLFEQQAARTPDAVGVVFEGQQLSYRELDERSNRLARRLRGLGVGPESIVGVCMERSVEMVAALLGVLKSGGAYLPLDPHFPLDRIAYMLEDAKVCVLLTQDSLLDSLPEKMGAHLLCLDRDAADIARLSSQAAESEVAPNNLAYVIYTSGSTGVPKAVQIPHSAVVNFLHAMREPVCSNSSNTLLAVTSLSFDIAGLEIFLPLTTGAKVEVVSSRDASDGGRLSKLLLEFRASVMQATPTTWELLLSTGWRNKSGLKVLCGGEAMPPGLATRLLEDNDGPVWNLYGPTETTIWSAAQQIESAGSPVTIGRPIANTQMYIVDEFFQPWPLGVVGELLIGGAGVARGYLSRPELTADRFIPDSFSQQAGARLYRTGDLARFQSDGSIELLGRVDHQVKVRGHRIELGEIEAVLSRHPLIRRAVVVSHEDTPGDKRLIAYLVVKEETEPTVSELRAYLKGHLPEFMIPSAFVILGELPLTPNGKVDRRALPAPEQSRPELAREYVGPSTAVEEKLCDIWSAVLRVERVGVYDDFFDLGGDSLLAQKMLGEVERELRITVPMRTALANPTVAQLSMHIERVERAKKIGMTEEEQFRSIIDGLSDKEVQALLGEVGAHR